MENKRWVPETRNLRWVRIGEGDEEGKETPCLSDTSWVVVAPLEFSIDMSMGAVAISLH